MDDVLADEPARDHEAVRIHIVQAEKPLRQIADGLAHVYPRLVSFVEVNVPQTVRIDDIDLLVLAFAEVRVDDDRPVVAGVDQRLVVAVPHHRPNYAVKLPRRGRTPRIKEMPGDVDLQCS